MVSGTSEVMECSVVEGMDGMILRVSLFKGGITTCASFDNFDTRWYELTCYIIG